VPTASERVYAAEGLPAAGVVNQELSETIDRLWPENLGYEKPKTADTDECPDLNEGGRPISAQASGYVDAIDDEGLLRLARERDLVIRLARRPGHFVVLGNPLALVWPIERSDDETSDLINGMFTLTSHRTPFQDVEFAIDQLVEIAVRALSPGINDPFTAMACIDRLCEALCQLCQRRIPSSHRYDQDKRLRIIAKPVSFESVMDAAFNQIRQYGRGNPAVLIRLLESLAIISNHAKRVKDLESLERHTTLVHRASAAAVPEEADRKDIDARFEAVHAALRNARKSE